MKAIHFVNEREGIGRVGLETVKAPGSFATCCWKLSESEVEELQNGWVYLHDSKSKNSGLGGGITKITGVVEPDGTISRYKIFFDAVKDCRNVKWRGKSHGMAWSGGVVDAGLHHEI